MPLDGQVAELLAQIAALGKPPISQQSVEEARAGAEDMVMLAGEPIPVGSVRDITIPVDGTTIGARVYTPEGDGPHPIVMFFHGGGWVICSLDTHDNIARTICRDADALVVSVDYRMAPEFRFPTAPYDCFAATRWVADNAASLGGDAGRLAVCGDSAGGNLSAVVSQMARDSGGPTVTFAALIYPGVDMTAHDGSMIENSKGYFLELDDMNWFMNHYLSEQDWTNPLASPMLHENLADLPALLHRDLRIRSAPRPGRGVRCRTSGQRCSCREQALRRHDPRRGQHDRRSRRRTAARGRCRRPPPSRPARLDRELDSDARDGVHLADHRRRHRLKRMIGTDDRVVGQSGVDHCGEASPVLQDLEPPHDVEIHAW